MVQHSPNRWTLSCRRVELIYLNLVFKSESSGSSVCRTFARKRNFLTASVKRSHLLWIDLQVQCLVIPRLFGLSTGYEADLYGAPPHCFTKEFLHYSGQNPELVLGLNIWLGGLWFVGSSEAGWGWSHVKEPLKQTLLSPGQRRQRAFPGRVSHLLHTPNLRPAEQFGSRYGKSWGRRIIVRFLLRAHTRKEKHLERSGAVTRTLPPGV